MSEVLHHGLTNKFAISMPFSMVPCSIYLRIRATCSFTSLHWNMYRIIASWPWKSDARHAVAWNKSIAIRDFRSKRMPWTTTQAGKTACTGICTWMCCFSNTKSSLFFDCEKLWDWKSGWHVSRAPLNPFVVFGYNNLANFCKTMLLLFSGGWKSFDFNIRP